MSFESQLSDWLSFNGTVPILQPCVLLADMKTNSSSVSCSQVCSNSSILFQSPYRRPKPYQYQDYQDVFSNLNTCGLWATINNPESTSGISDTVASYLDDLLDPFESIGLSSSNRALASNTRNNIGNCFGMMYTEAAWGADTNQRAIPWECTSTGLFPAFAGNSSVDVLARKATVPVKHCLASLCAKKTLNTDLGGIGVLSQSSTYCHMY